MSSAPRAELEALLVLKGLPGLGDRSLARLLLESASPKELLSLPGRSFERGAGRPARAARGEPARLNQARTTALKVEKLGIRPLWVGRPDYPARLLDLHDPPPLVFMRGSQRRVPGKRVVAVVGSRSATPYGLRVAGAFARAWSRRGIPVISGLALGVDAAAHEGALAGGGITGGGPGERRGSPGSRKEPAPR